MTKNDFKAVFSEYYSALVHFAVYLIKDEQRAEDLVQDVFLKIWNSDQQLDLNKNPKSYLMTAVRFAALDYLKKEKQNIVSLDQIDETVAEEHSYEIFDQYMLKEEISKSLRHLPPRCCDIFVMSKLKGYSHKEIASELDISIKTIENQMTKAYKLLRERLSNKMPRR